MKKLITVLSIFFTVLFVLISNSTFASDRYVRTGGNDSNSGLDSANAWATLTKVNSFWSSLSAGDHIYLHRGDTFTGTITATKAGNAGNPIIIDAFGTGAKPIINGFTTVSAWTNTPSGSNLWESTSAISGAVYRVRMVTIGGVDAPMGRYPNTGYKTMTSFTTNTGIGDATLSTAPNCVGGDLVTRKYHWNMAVDSITAQTSSAITVAANSNYNFAVGDGYFLQNALSTLDLANEWYFDQATRKLTIFSATAPTNVKVSMVDTLINTNGYDYIYVNNIQCIGANLIGIAIGNSGSRNGRGIVVDACDINFSGMAGIYGSKAVADTVKNSTINHSGSNGIRFNSVGGECQWVTITSNTVTNSGMIPGRGSNIQGGASGGGYGYSAIVVNGKTSKIYNNTVDSAGYCGIMFFKDSCEVKYNKVNYYNPVLDDGGGIYTWTGSLITYNGRKIINNIVLNGIGAPAGTVSNTNSSVAIYADDYSVNIQIDSNSISTVGNSGLYLHNSSDLQMRYNTVYNAAQNLFWKYSDATTAPPARNFVFTNNILFTSSTTTTPIFLNVDSRHRNDADSVFLSINNNNYSRPKAITGRLHRTTYWTGTALAGIDFTLATWKSTYATAWHGAYDPTSISMPTNTGTSRFEYNASNTASKVYFSGLRYTDPLGNIYDDSATIRAWGSTILVLVGTVPVNTPPVVHIINADSTVQLPQTFMNLSGYATDSGGITGYVWSVVNGPTGSSFSPSNTTQTPTITGLVAGRYVVQLQATDNQNAKGYDSLIITVNPVVVIPPPTSTIIAPFSITLPTNSGVLSGTGTVTGTPTYQWRHLSAGTALLVSPTAATTNVTSLTQGLHNFSFTVFQTNGDSVVKTTSITVLPAIPPPNKPPVIDSIRGTTTITAPSNIVHVRVYYHDTDGVVNQWRWVKTSGTAGGSIVTQFIDSTDIISLVPGTNIYSVTVKDNANDSTSKSFTVIVNSAPINQAPSASIFGGNQTIVQPGTTTTIQGSGTDIDGFVKSCAISFVSGPVTPIISPASVGTANILSNITGLNLVGDYTFRLTVTDNQNATGTATIVVTVNTASGGTIHGKKKFIN